MSKGNRIKWRKTDEDTIRRTANAFNRKIDAYVKQAPELSGVMPEKVKVSELVKNLKKTNRDEFNFVKKSLNRFLEPGAESVRKTTGGKQITQWEYEHINRLYKKGEKLNAAELQRVQNVQATNRNKPTGLKRQDMDDTRASSLLPHKNRIETARSGQEFTAWAKAVEKRAMAHYRDEELEQYKTNYIKGLKTVFKRKSAKLRAELENVPPEVFRDMYEREEIGDITFIYDKFEADAKWAGIKDIWVYTLNSRALKGITI